MMTMITMMMMTMLLLMMMMMIVDSPENMNFFPFSPIFYHSLSFLFCYLFKYVLFCFFSPSFISLSFFLRVRVCTSLEQNLTTKIVADAVLLEPEKKSTRQISHQCACVKLESDNVSLFSAPFVFVFCLFCLCCTTYDYFFHLEICKEFNEKITVCKNEIDEKTITRTRFSKEETIQ